MLRTKSRSPRRLPQDDHETPVPFVTTSSRGPSRAASETPVPFVRTTPSRGPSRAPSVEIGTERAKSLTFSDSGSRPVNPGRVAQRSSSITHGDSRSHPYSPAPVPILRPEIVSVPPRARSESVGRAPTPDYEHGFTPSKQFKMGDGKGKKTGDRQGRGRRPGRTIYNEIQRRD